MNTEGQEIDNASHSDNHSDTHLNPSHERFDDDSWGMLIGWQSSSFFAERMTKSPPGEAELQYW